MSDLQRLKDQRAEVVSQMRALHETAEKEDRGFTSDEDAKWAKMDADLQVLDGRIARAAKIETEVAPSPSQLRAAMDLAGKHNPDAAGDEKAAEAEFRAVFDKFVRHGMQELTPEERGVMSGRRNQDKELRAFSSGTGNTGAYTVPQDFRDKLDIALKYYGGMMDSATIMQTDTGATLPMPSFNYTSVLATIVGENTAGSADTSTPFGVANLGAYTYRSPILPVSYEFLQDSAFGDQFIIDALSQSIGRAVNAHFTTGTGTGQPRGVTIDAVLGKAGTTGQTTTVIFDDLIDLVHSIDPAYRANGCRFQMHDSSLKVVRKLKDSQNRPIFLPGYDGLAGAMADTLLGYNITVNQDLATMAANAKSILFGRFDKYIIRRVKDVTILRLTERYADSLQVGFILFARYDGRLLDAGTNPVKYYANSAT